MTTIREFATEFEMQPYELVAFADDLLDGFDETDEIPGGTEAILREAITAAGPQEPTTAEINRREDSVIDDLREIVEASGYAEQGYDSPIVPGPYGLWDDED